MLYEYHKIFIFILVCAGFGSALLFVPFLINKLKPDKEKLSSYECGVEPIGEARARFDIHFYLVAMIFIIFDLEIVMLLPWTILSKTDAIVSFVPMISFFLIIAGSFLYEWKKDVINW